MPNTVTGVQGRRRGVEGEEEVKGPYASHKLMGHVPMTCMPAIIAVHPVKG
jgi:hypothetical protein